MHNLQVKPVARRKNLVIQEIPGEILVYDLETNKAHCLNETSAFVWNRCDGKNSITDLSVLLGSHTGKPVEENLVWLAIDQLNENNLLAHELQANFGNQTRREVIRKIGLAAVISLPLVASLVAPTAALAVSCSSGTANCSPGGQTCTDGTACTGCQNGSGCICCVGICSNPNSC